MTTEASANVTTNGNPPYELELKEVCDSLRTLETLLWTAAVVWLTLQGFGLRFMLDQATGTFMRFVTLFGLLMVDGIAFGVAGTWMGFLAKMNERLVELSDLLRLGTPLARQLQRPMRVSSVLGLSGIALVAALTICIFLVAHAQQNRNPPTNGCHGRTRCEFLPGSRSAPLP